MSVRVIATLGSSTQAAPLLLSPTPVAAPTAPTGQPDRGRLAVVLPWFLLTAVLVVGGAAAAVYHAKTSADSDFGRDGAAWSRELVGTFADSADKAQTEILEGTKPLDDIKAAHISRWKDARDKAFNDRFVRSLDAIIPPGTDKPTVEQRRRYAAAFHEIATGARGAVK